MRPGGWRVGNLWVWKDSCSPDPRPPALWSWGGGGLQECLCSGHQHLTAQHLLDSSMTIPGCYTHFTDGKVEARFRDTHLLPAGWVRSQNLRFWHVGPALPDGFSAYLHVQVLLSVRDVQNETGSWVRHLGCHMPPCVPRGVAQQEVWVGGLAGQSRDSAPSRCSSAP